MTPLTRRLALVSPFALAACGTQTPATVAARVIREIDVGVVPAIGILANARPDILTPDTAVKVTAGLLGARDALVALRDGLPGFGSATSVWDKVDAAIVVAQGILSALVVPGDLKRYVTDAQLAMALVRALVAGAR